MTHPARKIWHCARWFLLPVASQLLLIYPLTVEMGKWEPLAFAAVYIATSAIASAATAATFIIWLIRKRKPKAHTCEQSHTSAATSSQEGGETKAGSSQTDKSE